MIFKFCDDATATRIKERFRGSMATNAKSLNEARTSRGSIAPINIILKNPRKDSKLYLPKPRVYQEKLYKKALEKNVIIYLGTGLGKTYIVVLFLNSPSIASDIRCGRKVVFLAPKQDLVRQQAEYVSHHTPYRVRVYCGVTHNSGVSIDHWGEESWKQELVTQDVLFMTPAIFANAIAVGHLKWTDFQAVIFDEVHHASRIKTGGLGSDYYRTLINYKQDDRNKGTRLIGLTAPLINHMPKRPGNIIGSVRYIERLLNAEIVTDIRIIERLPKFVVHSHNAIPLTAQTDTLMKIFESFSRDIATALKAGKAKSLMFRLDKNLSKKGQKVLALHNKLNRDSRGLPIKPESFHIILEQLGLLRDTCGLWILAHVCCKLVGVMRQHKRSSFITDVAWTLHSDFISILEKILQSIDSFMFDKPENLLFDYTQPKLLALLDVLRLEHESLKSGGSDTFSCIIFVKSRIMVVAICNWLQEVSRKIERYNFIKVDYAIGSAATYSCEWSCITKRKSLEQIRVLDQFRKKILNVVVATSVLEEGIDLPVCSTVIRFDETATFRAFVQSRGRARQHRSSYIVLSERSKSSEAESTLRKFNDLEKRVRATFRGQTHKDIAAKNSNRPKVERAQNDEVDVYQAPNGKFRIDAVAAKTILHMYCQSLVRKRPFSEMLQYERLQPRDGIYQTRLFFPSACPIRSCLGNEKKSKKLADLSAIVAAIKALHEANELDDHAVPRRATEKHVDQVLAKCHLNIEIGPLNKVQEGETVKYGEREVIMFDWVVFNQGDSLLRNCSSRRYNLFKITFHARDGKVRNDTRDFFTSSNYGIILDDAISSETWPKELFNPYGEFEVVYDRIGTHITLSDADKHAEYFDHTFKVLTQFCRYRVNRDDFRKRCSFYQVPLGPNNTIERITSNKSDVPIKCSDVVSDRYIHAKPKLSDKESPDIHIYLVKAIHHDMNANSIIPGQNRTFKQYLFEEYGEQSIEIEQPVIEVLPIIRETARSFKGKNIDIDYNNRNVYFLQQQMEFVHSRASDVFQAFNLPPIIYQIYLTSSVNELNQEFLRDTSSRRSNPVLPAAPQPAHQADGDSISTLQVVEGKKDCKENDESSDKLTDAKDNDDDDQYSDDSGSDYDHSNLIDGDLAHRSQLKTAISCESLDPELNKNDLTEKRNLNQYKCDNSKAVDVHHRFSTDFPLSIHLDPYFDKSFGNLWKATSVHKDNILARIRKMQTMIVSDRQFQGKKGKLNRPRYIVDLKLKPTMKYDKNSQPMRSCTRIEALLEALVLRRANPAHNLELLKIIGSSYLKYSMSVVLYKTMPDEPEGSLTSILSGLRSKKFSKDLARKSYLGCDAITNKYDASLLELILNGPSKNPKGIRNFIHPKDLADIFESVVGACLVSGGEFEAILAMEWLGLTIFPKEIFREFRENVVSFAPASTALIDSDNRVVQKIFEQNKRRLRPLEKRLSYDFKDPSYLIQATTHASSKSRCTESYERLEFLGDAILDKLITDTLFQAGFNTPGQITASRSALVNNVAFAKLSIKYGLHLFILHSNQELYDELVRVNAKMSEDPSMDFFDMIEFDKIVKFLGDIFESVAGAIYLDSGCSLDTIWSIYYPMLKEAIDKEIANPTKNPVAQLYELFPGMITIEYSKLEEDPTITSAKCAIWGYGEFFGEGSSEPQARDKAVQAALNEKPPRDEIFQLRKEFEKMQKEQKTGVLRPKSSRRRRCRRGGQRRGSKVRPELSQTVQ